MQSQGLTSEHEQTHPPRPGDSCTEKKTRDSTGTKRETLKQLKESSPPHQHNHWKLASPLLALCAAAALKASLGGPLIDLGTCRSSTSTCTGGPASVGAGSGRSPWRPSVDATGPLGAAGAACAAIGAVAVASAVTGTAALGVAVTGTGVLSAAVLGAAVL